MTRGYLPEPGVTNINRPRVLVFLDYYLPGYRGGGPLRTISAMANRLGDDFEFLVVTSDRDVGDQAPYPSLTPCRWTTVGHTSVYYLRAEDRRLSRLRKLVRSTPHDIIYLNSLFSLHFSIKLLLLRRLKLIHPSPVVLAPRGELGSGSLGSGYKNFKKRSFNRIARVTRLYNGVLWHASSHQELAEIHEAIGNVRGCVAPNLADELIGNEPREPKKQGHARILFLSRITSKKNLHGAIDILRQVHGEVDFAVCGSLEDARYWKTCQALAATLPSNITFRYIGAAPHAAVPSLLRKYDLLFLPTLHENFGHVILESLTVGTPVLISDRTPWKSLERHAAGWDIALSDHSSFVKAIQEIIQKDDVGFAYWSNGARSLAQRQLASDESAKRNGDLLRCALRSSRAKEYC